MRRYPKWAVTFCALLCFLAACSGDPGGSGPTDPPPPDPDPDPEVPEACLPPPAIGFDRDVAALLAELADTAYDVDASWPAGRGVSSNADCWQFVRFLEFVDPDGWVDTQLYIAQNQYTDDLVVAFRGSQESTDFWTDGWATAASWLLPNGSVIANSVHSGFNAAYRGVEERLREELMALLAAAGEASPRVYFTGHSLGGALATMAALDLANPLVDAGVTRSDVILYSFGAPRSLTELLTPHFATLVPNAYAVAILRDWVTHVPESLISGSNEWAHIPNMVVLHGQGARTRADQGPGSKYNGCIGVPIPLDFSHHGIEEMYLPRIAKLGAPVSEVSLSVSADGNLVLHWNDEAVGPCDWIGLYHGYPTNADDHLGQFSWQWAENGSSYKTWWAKGDNYYAAYVNEFGEILARSAAYVPTTPSVWISRYDGLLADWVQLNWSVSDPGENDFVALYSSPPLSAGTNGYLTLQWQWALEGNSYATTTTWGRGYYIAYIMEDDAGRRRILAWAGPN